MDIRIFTDGSCSDNGKTKNKGSYGLVVVDIKDKILFEHVESVPDTTNNRMEMNAIIKAFEVCKIMDYKTCIIYSDSKYCVDGINSWMKNWAKKGWKTANKDDVKNKDLWEKLLELSEKTKGVNVQWMKGHQNKNTWNDYIDAKIVALHNDTKKEKQEIINMNEPIKIDIPLFDIPEQKILDKRVYGLELHDQYFKYEHDYCAEEVDRVAWARIIRDIEDPVLLKAYEDDKPFMEVCRKQVSYTDRQDISSIFLIKNSDDKDIAAIILLSIKDGDEYPLMFNDETKAEEILEILLKWRWK